MMIANPNPNDPFATPLVAPTESLVATAEETHSDAASDAGQDQLRYGFHLGCLNLLVNRGEISELVKKPKIYPVPKAAPGYVGLINLRGGIVSVFDLKHALQLDSAKSDHSHVLILGKGERAVGVIIDGLPQSLVVSENHASAPGLPENIDAGVAAYARESYTIDASHWMEFDYRNFLHEQVTSHQ